jgi:hypothetical protein
MTFASTFIAYCEVLGLFTPFLGTCWGHAMSKCSQYPTNDSKVCVDLTSISINETQLILFWIKPSLGQRKVVRDN